MQFTVKARMGGKIQIMSTRDGGCGLAATDAVDSSKAVIFLTSDELTELESALKAILEAK